MRLRDAVALSAFTLLWLAPMLYHGFVRGSTMPFYPRALVHLTNVSCLFIHSLRDWLWLYVQVQPRPGAPWQTLRDEDYFGMQAFGYHSRLEETARRLMSPESLFELLDWVGERYVERHPEAPPPQRLRIVAGVFRVGDPVPRERWTKPPLESLPADRVGVFVERPFRAPRPDSRSR